MSDLIAVAIVDLKAGPALDWAVAKALGVDTDLLTRLGRQPVVRTKSETEMFWTDYSPSTDWVHGGPLLDRLEVASWQCGSGGHYFNCSIDNRPAHGFGVTMLEAVCRALVAHKFGDAVSIPRELLEVAK